MIAFAALIAVAYVVFVVTDLASVSWRRVISLLGLLLGAILVSVALAGGITYLEWTP